ncbi:methyltransferase [Thaumasiovibrio sp. DFM-14]|uniref:methyltransferase n=1 Tax=Thaumasiovibrio sp. DFM-14 TaxID=3384792 RepID=UPI0039A186E7
MQSYHHQFQHLDHLLTCSRRYWQFMPFEKSGYYWENAQPLLDWLNTLNDEDVIALKGDLPRLSQALSPFIPQAEALYRAGIDTNWPLVEVLQSQVIQRGLDSGIPGRKWTQIEAFSRALPISDVPFLEWCAGKAHLGRVMADIHRRPVVSLEWQVSLCQQGEAYANKLGLPVSMQCEDAFSAAAARHIHSEQHAVALHACGDLHTRLLQLVAQQKTRFVTISPCCYHLIKSERYQALSLLAQASEISLSRHDLRLPLQETVTAPNRVERLREIEMSFRLGFDLLQRSLTQLNRYIPVPNVKKAMLNQGFEAFCRWAAEQKSLSLPNDVDYAGWLQQGQQRFKGVERMELVRQLFRRPLELWLILDRVIYLQEQGYEVSVQRLCERAITPRNFFIQAQRQAEH